MAYTFQTFVFKAVLTSAQMNQVETNVRDHVHGTAGVVAVPDAGLSANVALKNIDNAFSVGQTITGTTELAGTVHLGGLAAATGLKVLPARNTFNTSDNDPVIFSALSAGDFGTAGELVLQSRSTTNADIYFVTGATPKIQLNVQGDGRIGIGMGSAVASTLLTVGDSTRTDSARIAFNPGTSTNAAGLFNGNAHNDVTLGSFMETAVSHGFISTGYTSTQRKFSIGHGSSSVFATATFVPMVTWDTLDDSALFTGDLKIFKSQPRLNIDAVAGDPQIDFRFGGAIQGSINYLANTFNIVNTAGTPIFTWDNVSGNMTLGNIPDARLTANVPLLNAANAFTLDQKIQKASATSIIDATTGNPLLRMQRAAVNSVALDSTATNILNFKNNADAARVSWDLSGANGKLTQGDVPHGGIFTHDFASITDTNKNITVTTTNTLSVGDIVYVTGNMGMPGGFTSSFDLNVDETGTAIGVFEPIGRVKQVPANTTGIIMNISAIFRCTSAGTGIFRIIVTSVTAGTFSKDIGVIHFKA